LFNRYVSRSKIPEVLELQCDYMELYEGGFASRISNLSSEPLDGDKYDLVLEKINELLVKLCARLEKSFEILTCGSCFASIKIYDATTGCLRTGARGFYEEHKRKHIDGTMPTFDYHSNSAFKNIIDGGFRGTEFFISNWLPLLWIIRGYKNKNPKWMQLYTATAVFPIYVESAPNQVVGFLCVDNLHGKFPKNLSKALLKSYSRPASKLLAVLGQIRRVG